MSEMKRLSDRNRAIQEMLTSGEGLKTFYRFVANNPHIALHDACQIVIERPSASICFSFEEWNAQGRRVLHIVKRYNTALKRAINRSLESWYSTG